MTDKTTDKIEHLKLVGIYHQNFMGLQAGEIELTGKENVFVVSGGNEAGKSRLISTIPFALGSKAIEDAVTKGMK
ncbi:MAG TPA: AAA family ATPase, partial [Alphaproteobacteria bacterium]|nr:AAA family ATPase [Alphaproteobacteria bacterium]